MHQAGPPKARSAPRASRRWSSRRSGVEGGRESELGGIGDERRRRISVRRRRDLRRRPEAGLVEAKP
uniref:Calcium-binding EF hand family protein, putative / protein phosphatase 2A 62 kDa B'' regulatory subunit, putative n=1 Tax=Arundo donax TaxID=35708 RepID=A0A0A9CUN5_ARUDO